MTQIIEAVETAARRMFRRSTENPQGTQPKLDERVEKFLKEAAEGIDPITNYGRAASLARHIYEGYPTDLLFGYQAEERGLHAVIAVTALTSAGEPEEAIGYAISLVERDRLLPPSIRTLLQEAIRENSTA